MYPMPVVFMRNEYDTRTMRRQNFSDDPDRQFPMRSVLLPGFKSDVLQTLFRRHDQSKSQLRTGFLQFVPPG